MRRRQGCQREAGKVSDRRHHRLERQVRKRLEGALSYLVLGLPQRPSLCLPTSRLLPSGRS
eukprot:3140527-Prorocentrum_lima.AAC.1